MWVEPRERDILLETVRREGKCRNLEVHTRLKSGEITWTLLSASTIELDGTTCLLSVGRDITERKRAEMALRESNDLMQLFVEQAPVSIAMFDREMRYLAASRQHQTGLGLAAREIIGHSHYEFFPTLPEHFREAHRRAMAGEAVSGEDLCPKGLLGVEIWGRWSVHPWYTGAGAVGGIVLFTEDLTKRKQAEAALIESRAKLEAALASMTDAVFICDAGERLLEFNEAYAKFHKFKNKAECGTTIEESRKLVELLGAGGEPEPIETRPALRALRGESGTDAEYTLRRKDTGESWIGSYSYAPIRDKDGVITGAVAIARDVTEKKRVEAALRESKELLQLFIEQAPVALAMFDREMRCLAVSRRWLGQYGLLGQEIIGRSHYEINPGVPERLKEAHRRGLAGETVKSDEDRFNHPDGKERWVRWQVVPWRAGDGSVGGILIFTEDITERKLEQTALRDSRQLLELFIKQSPAALVMLDREMRHVAASLRWLETFSLKEEEIIGRSHYEVIPYIPEHWKEAHLRGMAGEVVRVDAELNEMPDGTRVWTRYEVMPWRKGNGDVGGIIICGEDITERIAAQEALERAEEKYREIFEDAPEGIFQISPEGRALTLNPAAAEMLGYESADEAVAAIQDATHDLWFYPEDRARFLALLDQQGTLRDFQCQLKRKDGKPIWVAATEKKVTGPDGKTICYQGFNQDITEQKRLEAALRANSREFELLSEINNALVHSKTEKGLLRNCCRIMVEIGGYRMAWVGFADEGPDKPIVTIADYGCEEGFLEGFDLTWADTGHEDGPVGRSLRTGEVQVEEDICADPLVHSWRTEAVKHGYRMAIALPFRLTDGAIASLAVFGETPGIRTGSERRLMEQIASDLAYGIETQRAEIARTRHQEDLRAALEQTIHVIAETVDQRDPYTAGHERRVADLCMRIAQKLDLPDDRTHGLHLAASIHDLGKIGIPAEILSKPGLLTPIQFNLLKEHAQLGYDILKNVAFPWPIADMILQHHERLDGSGYPRGLKGDAISLEARILAVADVVEAMSSHRPYRASKGVDVALDEILAERGTLYDAQVADACARVFREDGYEFPAQAS
jgi:PAS domain S-box-containing protein